MNKNRQTIGSKTKLPIFYCLHQKKRKGAASHKLTTTFLTLARTPST